MALLETSKEGRHWYQFWRGKYWSGIESYLWRNYSSRWQFGRDEFIQVRGNGNYHHINHTLPPEIIHQNATSFNINKHVWQWWIGEKGQLLDATDTNKALLLDLVDADLVLPTDHWGSKLNWKMRWVQEILIKRGWRMGQCFLRQAGSKSMDVNTISINATFYENNQQQHRYLIHVRRSRERGNDESSQIYTSTDEAHRLSGNECRIKEIQELTICLSTLGETPGQTVVWGEES